VSFKTYGQVEDFPTLPLSALVLKLNLTVVVKNINIQIIFAPSYFIIFKMLTILIIKMNLKK